MKYFENYSLKDLNTFGVESFASSFYSFENVYELIDSCHPSKDPFVLGGGSNILLLNDIDKEVWSYDVKGIEVIKENSDHVLVEVQGGEVWHDLVLWTIDENFGGLENLALIPGKVGAAPIQNIGAYGVELKDVLHCVHCINRKTGLPLTFFNDSCEFGYRDSIFKRKCKDTFVITSIVLKLSKPDYHIINDTYGAIGKVLEEKKINRTPTIKEISKAVIDIRSSKLPDPNKIGNAGSFFKNPIIDVSQFVLLKKSFENIASYPVSDKKVKIPAGWLIDQAGWKGKRIGHVGCYENQALVITSDGKASGKEIFDFSTQVINSVYSKYGIQLEREVNMVK